jgi:hypothetical protein
MHQVIPQIPKQRRNKLFPSLAEGSRKQVGLPGLNDHLSGSHQPLRSQSADRSNLRTRMRRGQSGRPNRREPLLQSFQQQRQVPNGESKRRIHGAA